MSETEDRDGTEALDYLLGELDDADRVRFETRLDADPTLRERVADAEEVMSALRALPSDGWEATDLPPLAPLPNGSVPVTAPEIVVPPEPASSRLGRAAVPWYRRGPAIAAGGFAVLLAGLAIGAAIGGDDAGDPSPVIEGPEVLGTSDLSPASSAGRGAGGRSELLADVRSGEEALRVSVEGMPATAPGRYYELWFMRGTKLVSLGGFRVGEDGARTVTVPLPVDPSDFRLVDISLERSDGGPGHSATSMLRGPIA